MGITIRTERPDAPDVHRLIAASAGILDRSDFTDTIVPTPEGLARKGVQLLVARQDGAVVGWSALIDEISHGEIAGPVLPDADASGEIARDLIAAAEDSARDIGLGCLLSRVGPDRTDALALFAAQGFAARDPADDPADPATDAGPVIVEKRIGLYFRSVGAAAQVSPA